MAVQVSLFIQQNKWVSEDLRLSLSNFPNLMLDSQNVLFLLPTMKDSVGPIEDCSLYKTFRDCRYPYS